MTAAKLAALTERNSAITSVPITTSVPAIASYEPGEGVIAGRGAWQTPGNTTICRWSTRPNHLQQRLAGARFNGKPAGAENFFATAPALLTEAGQGNTTGDQTGSAEAAARARDGRLNVQIACFRPPSGGRSGATRSPTPSEVQGMHYLFRRQSPAMAVAFIALLAALSGTAIALPGKNSIDSGDIRKNAVTSKKVKNNSLVLRDFKASQRSKLRGPQGPQGPQGPPGGGFDGAAAGGDLTGTYPNPLIADNAVTSAKVADSTLLSADVSDDTTAGGGLDSPDLRPNSVGPSEIQTDGVGATEIQNDSIDAGEIVDFGLTNQDVGVLFAEVAAAGGLDNSSGGVTVIKLGGLGTYEVDFGRNITACASVATIGPSGGGSALGEVNVADRGGNAEAVFVDTNNSDGTAADKPFRLIVTC